MHHLVLYVSVGNRVEGSTRRTLKLRIGDGRLRNKEWLKGHLQRQVDVGGDPIIVLHVLRAASESAEMRLFCAVPFKCSDLIKVLWSRSRSCEFSRRPSWSSENVM